MASTALVALLATGAIAQDASSSMMDTSAMSSSAMPADSSASAAAPAESSAMDASTMSSQMTDASSMESSMMPAASGATASHTPFDVTTGYTVVDTDRLASKIIGSPVYDGTAADSNNLGNIKDLVLDQNGNIAAVVVGVGGFLGLGEKQVAVDFASLQWTTAADNTERFVLAATKDQLTSAPDFKTVEDQPSGAVTDTTTMSSSAAQ